ncbi:MAG: Glycogen operon protein GlgX [Phycisphaerae bacterium]|nr:Glycogen operon protein GlgX [Phycisphaerae bacterium]
MQVEAGKPYPLGAHWDGRGVNFALFSHHATSVTLCLFERHDAQSEYLRIPLRRRTNRVWHVYVPGFRPGLLYGYRVDGPFMPDEGHYFNPYKLLIDPYARALSGPCQWHRSQVGYMADTPDQYRQRSTADSAAYVPKAVIIDPTFDWEEDRPPRVPWHRTVIYECHVKGLTKLHPEIPPEIRGTYTALGAQPIIDHLLHLGITAVELLPIHQFFNEGHLVDKKLVNYWGYSSIGFFAPEARYATSMAGQQVIEFKQMVKQLHRAGLEVILDVVYNHTGEGNHLGPTICYRGLDNASYYRLAPNQRRYYWDSTGCGNSLDTTHPRVLQLILDNLRYWVEEMHVDGFRFDLAPTLSREPHHIDRWGRIWAAMLQDPVLAECKLIAEPWDLGFDGYQTGRYPIGWSEWNDRFRDTVRKFWRNQPGQTPEFVGRLTGSSDLYEHSGRQPTASINFVCCHDGQTLRDVVSYEGKHNLANGEENRDGTNDNYSCNWGVEGPSGNETISTIREQVQRNMLATLAFSMGVPMLAAGDELGRSQQGNNNAYCQDNELSWVNWELADWQKELLRFTQLVFAIRRENPVFCRAHFYHGVPMGDTGLKDVNWLRPDGQQMKSDDWHDGRRNALGMLIPGQSVDIKDEEGWLMAGGMLLLLLNAGNKPVRFKLPAELILTPGRWRQLLNTAQRRTHAITGATLTVAAHSLQLLAYELK